MALIKCKECNAEVSDRATKCVSCGARLRKPKRGFFGVIFKWSFILFNILMVVWLFGAMSSTGEIISSAQSEAAQAGAAIGTTLGLSMILGFWAIGDIILGMLVLFTRPRD